MKLSHLSESVTFEASSLVTLLEQGLQSIRQGLYAEGATYFALARQQISPDCTYIATILDTLVQSFTNYQYAQQALHEASKRFAETDSMQQAQVVMLEKLLPTLMQKEESHASHVVARSTANSQDHQLLQLLQTSITEYIGRQTSTELPVPPDGRDTLPALYFTCFGRFAAQRLNQSVALCSNRCGQAMLRYLVVQAEHCATSDTLMAMLWPEDEPESAQSKLHNAVCALRRSLNHGYTCEQGGGYILCKNRVYYLNPKVEIQTDVDEFLLCYQVGQQISKERIVLYERACRLYTGPFLAEDLYSNWSFLQREQVSRTYLAMCRELVDYYFTSRGYEDAVQWATAMLKENHCDEVAHRYLMQIYIAQGRRSEALQQYRHCERILREELSVSPLPETMGVFEKLGTKL
jgi:DNA-binding SARP family transcriptional activator